MQLHRRELDPLYDRFPTLETNRFVFRRMAIGDAPALFDMLQDPDVVAFTGRRPVQIMSEAVDVLRTVGLDFATRRAVRWAVSVEADLPLLGTVGVHDWDRFHGVIGIGFDVARPHWGQGIATEAAEAVIHFAFENLSVNRVEADIMAGNDACIRVLERLGFEREGVQKERLYKDGAYHDVLLYALRRSQVVQTH
jgi:ribosomal-protein-alanine N-acetyltransferase